MPANFAPVFPLTPNIAFGKLTTANTATDGTGTVATIFTAGTFGARLDKVVARPLGTNVASVARFFLNNGAATTTATNNTLIAELDLPASTSGSAASIGAVLEIAFDTSLPAGWKLLVVIGTTVATGWQFTSIGGDY